MSGVLATVLGHLLAQTPSLDDLNEQLQLNSKILSEQFYYWTVVVMWLIHVGFMSYEAGVKIAVGTDAPAIPHGKNADELVTLVDWGIPAAAVLRAATVVAADLINRTDLGRIAEGYLADVIAVPGNPLEDISVTQHVNFVMKGGKVYRHDAN